MPKPLSQQEQDLVRKELKLQAGQDITPYVSLLGDNGVQAIIKKSSGGPSLSVPSPSKTPGTFSQAPDGTWVDQKTTPALAPSSPTPVVAPKPVTITGTPLPFALPRPTRSPVVVQPETGMLPRSLTNLSGEDKLQKTVIDKKAELAKQATAPLESRISPEAEIALSQKAERLANEPRTAQGERRTLTPTPRTATDIFGTGFIGQTLAGVLPQTIVTPEQAKSDKQRRDKAYTDAQTFARNNPNLFAGTDEENKQSFYKVVDGYYYEGAAPSYIGKMVQRATQSTLPSGAIVESPLVTFGKILTVPEAALTTAGVGLSRGAFAGQQALSRGLGLPTYDVPENEQKTLPEVMGEEVASGMGLMGSMSSSFRQGAKLSGASQDVQDYAGALGGLAGFGGGLLIPLDLGAVSAIGGAAKGGTGAAKVAKAFGEGSTGVAKAAVVGAAKGGVEGAWDAYKIFTPRTGGSVAISDELQAQTQKLLNSPKLKEVSNVVLDLAANPRIHAAIEADHAAGIAAAKAGVPYSADNINALIMSEYDIGVAAGKYPRKSFAQFIKEAEGYGIDFTNTAGRRSEAAAKPPPNVRIKEAEDALQTTRLGTTTTNYFDDIAIGGRSDLYYNAFLDSLDDAVKQDLLGGKSIKNSDILPAIDRYMNDVKETISGEERISDVAARVRVEAEKLHTALQLNGIEVTLERILGDLGQQLPKGVEKIGPKSSGNFISPLTKKGQEAIDKAFRIDTVKRFTNNFTGKTGIVGQQVKIGNVTLSKADAAKTLQDVKKKVPILQELRSAYDKKTGLITVTKAQIEKLRDYYTRPFQTTFTSQDNIFQSPRAVTSVRPITGYSPYNVEGTLSRLEQMSVTAGEKIVMSPDQYNDLIRGAIAIESSSKVTAKSQEELGRIAGTLYSNDKRAELSYFVREVFKPKDFAENTVGGFLVDTSRRFTEPSNSNPVVRGIIGEVNSRMGALADTFKAKMRKEMGTKQIGITKGVDRPTAFANVMVKEFTEGPVFRPQIVEESMKATRTGEVPVQSKVSRIGSYEVGRTSPRMAQEVSDAMEAGSYEMFRTNMSAMFGGYERTIDSISTTGRIVDLDKQAIATVEMRRLVSVLMETPAVKRYVNAFQEAVMAGDNIAALNIMQRMHVDFYGYSIEQILTRKGGITSDKIVEELRRASAAASRNTASDVTDFFAKPNQNIRSIDESYRAASQQAMIIKPENFKELLTGSYFTKAQANILDDVLLKAQTSSPELFPSANILQDLAFNDLQTTKNALYRAVQQKVIELREGGQVDEALKIEQNLLPWILGRGAYGANAPARYTQDLFIAGIQDYVAGISSTTGKTSHYYDVLIGKETGELSKISGTADNMFYQSIIKKSLDDANIEPASLYKQVYGSGMRADATALFYQTALTDIKNQLKQPLAGSLQGVAEKTSTIPLLTKAAAGLKKPIFNAVNIKSITETMEGISLATTANKLDQVVAKNGVRVSEDIAKLEEAANHIIDQELSVIGLPRELQALAKKKGEVIDAANAAGKFDTTDQAKRVFTEYLIAGWNGVKNLNAIAKNGMLGGTFGLPNMGYLMTNTLTGPSIVAQTLGLGKGVQMLNPLLNMDTIQVMKNVYAPGWSKVDKIIINAPDGTIYTASQLAEFVTSGKIGRSQASAELTNKLIEASIDWAGKTGLYGDTNAVIKAVKRNFVNYNDMNVYSTLANAVDQQYRTNVFIQALKEGEGLEQSSKLARESLFDYGNLSDGEKNIVSKVMWFWTFRRNNWRSVYTTMLTNPRNLKVAFSQRRGWSYAYDIGEKLMGYDPQDSDYKYILKDYSENRMYLDLTEDKENQKRYATFGPPIPQVQAVADMIDYLSIPVGYVAARAGMNSESPDLPKTVYDFAIQVGKDSNPNVKMLAAAVVGIDLGTNRELQGYLDPKLMWYMRSNDAADYTFNTFVQTEVVPFDEEKPGVGKYMGYQWRIKKDDEVSLKNWSMIKALILQVGAQRTMTEQAPLLQTLMPTPGYEAESTMDAKFWKSMGVIAEQDAPLIEEVQRLNRAAAGREIKDITPMEIPVSERKAKP